MTLTGSCFVVPSSLQRRRCRNLFAAVLSAASLFCGATVLSAQSTSEPANLVTVNPNPADFPAQGRTQEVELLTDTRGVDFGPYIRQVLQVDSSAWHKLLSQDSGVAASSQGWTQIRLTIAPDGTISAMHLDDSSHRLALDRAAWGSLTSVGKLPPLPKDFSGPNLELRLRFNVAGDGVK